MVDGGLDAARREALDRIRAALATTPVGDERFGRYVDGLVASSLVIARSRMEPERLVRICGPVSGDPATVMMAGLDNPDTDYWQAPISPDATYVVEGRRGTAADLSFQLLTGDYDDPAALPASAGTLTLRDLRCGTDGAYRFEVGPHAQGANALVPTEPAAMLFCRETFCDWSTERPGTVSVRRLTGDAPSAPDGSIDELAADLLMRRTDVWLQFAPGAEAEILQAGFMHLVEPNTLVGPLQTSGGLPDQYSASGRFHLADDDALVITVEQADAPYLGIQVGDDLFASLPYVDRCSSRTAAQSILDDDGRIRWVVSHRDPGAHNWIHTTEAAQGFLFIRWQGLDPDDAPPTPTIEKTRLDDLPSLLPSTKQVDDRRRSDELAGRAAHLRQSGRIRDTTER